MFGFLGLCTLVEKTSRKYLERDEYNFYLVNLLNGIFEKFWGAGLTLNVDHCGDRHSPIGARAWCNGSTVE